MLVAIGLVVVSVVVLQIGPGPVSRSVSPAAAALHRIAAAADDQPPVTLSGDQFLESDYQASVLASQSQIGSTTITGAEATIGVTITQFADLLSTSCIHASFSVPTFASAAAQTAWTTAGLLLAPSPATTGSCEVDAGDPTQSRGGAGAINVSGLPDDPATLARDLERGTTGITRIDDPVGADTDVAFERAVLLLVEPVVGATPQFWSALYGAMSMIPGVNLLGTETTHSGDEWSRFQWFEWTQLSQLGKHRRRALALDWGTPGGSQHRSQLVPLDLRRSPHLVPSLFRTVAGREQCSNAGMARSCGITPRGEWPPVRRWFWTDGDPHRPHRGCHQERDHTGTGPLSNV